MQKYQVIEDMIKIGNFIENQEKFWKLIPEVQSNIAHSISPQYVESLDDIATFRGRIIKRWDKRLWLVILQFSVIQLIQRGFY